MQANPPPPHVESKLIPERTSSPCLTNKLCENALRISGVFCLALACVFAVTLICGMIQPALIIGLVISLVLAVVLLALSMRRVRREFPTSLPEGFLSIIKKEFPEVIYQLIIQERLTLQELRAVLSGLSSGTFTFPSPESQKKLERFGLERLQKSCKGIELPDLEKILLKNCPLYLINKLIQLGPKELPQSVNVAPWMYWLNRLALSDHDRLIYFTTNVWILSKVATQEEYEMLLKHAKYSTWDHAQDLLEDLLPRLEEGIIEHVIDGMGLTKDLMIGLLGGDWLLFLCKHGVTWKQLQLIKDLDCASVCLLEDCERSGRGSGLARLYMSTSRYIDESNSKAFDPHLTLFTFEELMEVYRERGGLDFYSATIKYLNKRSQNTLRKIAGDELPELPLIKINKDTAAIE
ncbi:Protein of unknown function (DUF1389) [Chlamydia poikilotherma]|uniref:DUF1389 domain-containing protein n=1 Tax=Chlamydia poikilotherma TaxID=1967783 RepID=A0A3B0QGY7_9CHLA|nr:DUF1389 domain-containing protein [Chlamydia poikilotherma]SYX09104.1 Protein of unknown function (DUF1389) [Chlamydia poikilotherma]